VELLVKYAVGAVVSTRDQMTGEEEDFENSVIGKSVLYNLLPETRPSTRGRTASRCP
jgi:hypothetical protein